MPNLHIRPFQAADEDAVIPTARQTEMARAVGARLAVVPDTGHMLPVEAPEALAALLRDCVGAA